MIPFRQICEGKNWLPLGGMGHEGTFWTGGSNLYLDMGSSYTCVYICINLEDMLFIFVGFNHRETSTKEKILMC